MNDYAKHRRENMRIELELQEKYEGEPVSALEDLIAFVMTLAGCVLFIYGFIGLLHLARRIFG